MTASSMAIRCHCRQPAVLCRQHSGLQHWLCNLWLVRGGLCGQLTDCPTLRAAGVGLAGSAGSAVVINSASVHAATVRQTDRPRRTIHVYYGRADQPHFSEHTVFPRRLSQGVGPRIMDYNPTQWP